MHATKINYRSQPFKSQKWQSTIWCNFKHDGEQPEALMSLYLTSHYVVAVKSTVTQFRHGLRLCSLSQCGLMDHLWMFFCQASFYFKVGVVWVVIVGHRSNQDSTGWEDTVWECFTIVIDHKTDQWGLWWKSVSCQPERDALSILCLTEEFILPWTNLCAVQLVIMYCDVWKMIVYWLFWGGGEVNNNNKTTKIWKYDAHGLHFLLFFSTFPFTRTFSDLL